MTDFCSIHSPSRIIKGLGVSPGKALGSVCLFAEGRHNNMPVYQLDNEQEVEFQWQRFLSAKAKAINEIIIFYFRIYQSMDLLILSPTYIPSFQEFCVK